MPGIKHRAAESQSPTDCPWSMALPAEASSPAMAAVRPGVANKGNGAPVMQRYEAMRIKPAGLCSVLALTVAAGLSVDTAWAEQPPAPCHPNPNAAADEAAVRSRG